MTKTLAPGVWLAPALAAAMIASIPSAPVQAGGPPVWPTPAATPAPVAANDATTPAPTPTPAPEADDATGRSQAATGEPPVADEGDPDDGEEINPGEVAFTDYRPFDLESIEAQPFASKLEGFAAGLRGLTRYSLFDGKVKFRLGGQLQVDGTAGGGSDLYETSFGPIESGVDLRRGGIFAVGRIKDFNFNLSFDVGADWGVDDAWIEGSQGGLEVWGHYLGKLRVGLMSEPFSLERQTSGYNTSFLERSLPVQTFSPGSNVGAMVHDSGAGGRFTWAVGLFSFGKSTDQNATTSRLSLTGRVTHLLRSSDDGRRLVHVGASVSLRSPTGGDIRYRSRPEARFVDYLADTGSFSAGNVVLAGLEVATVSGPVWAVAEAMRSDVSAEVAGDPVFSGGYLQVGWFLTGESRPYRTNSGTFERVRPLTKLRKGGALKKQNGGAWELVGRISRVDLSDGEIDGGTLGDLGAALNWYVNATTRIGLNYIHANTEGRGSANIVVLRLQYNPW